MSSRKQSVGEIGIKEIAVKNSGERKLMKACMIHIVENSKAVMIAWKKAYY